MLGTEAALEVPFPNCLKRSYSASDTGDAHNLLLRASSYGLDAANLPV